MVEYNNNAFTVHYTQDGKNASVNAQALLIATGITSNVDTLDLINTDIDLKPGNFIKVNEYLESKRSRCVVHGGLYREIFLPSQC